MIRNIPFKCHRVSDKITAVKVNRTPVKKTVGQVPIQQVGTLYTKSLDELNFAELLQRAKTVLGSIRLANLCTVNATLIEAWICGKSEPQKQTKSWLIQEIRNEVALAERKKAYAYWSRGSEFC